MLCHLVFITIQRWALLLYFLDSRTLLIDGVSFNGKTHHQLNFSFSEKIDKGNTILLNVDRKYRSHVSFRKSLHMCVGGEGQKVHLRIMEVWCLHSIDE